MNRIADLQVGITPLIQLQQQGFQPFCVRDEALRQFQVTVAQSATLGEIQPTFTLCRGGERALQSIGDTGQGGNHRDDLLPPRASLLQDLGDGGHFHHRGAAKFHRNPAHFSHVLIDLPSAYRAQKKRVVCSIHTLATRSAF
ncbi:MAG: hypothetical protein OXF22_10515 [Anaerolineaceae bacterium]|nr:hypothetical protein [Anaerolineaceae bacterium]